MIPPLYKHQEDDIEFFKSRPHVFNTSAPGTGKTRTLVEVIRQSPEHRPAIVFAPKSILQASWGNDLDRFAPELTWVIASATNRIEMLNKEVDVVITNHDAVTAILKHNPLSLRRFNFVIVDESTAFKNPTAQRSKALIKLSEGVKNRTGLTGTPTPNSILDIWNQLYFIDRGTRLGSRYYAFRAATCQPDTTGIHTEWKPKPGIESVITHQIADITIRRTLEECVDLPEQSNYHVYYQPNDKTLQAYFSMRKMAILEYGEGKAITAVHAASVLTKALQILSGAVYDGEGDYILIDPQRYNLITDLAEQRQHTLIAYTWRHQKEELIKLIRQRNLSYAVIDGDTPEKKRPQIVEEYQNGQYRILLAHPKSTGHGLTLTKASAVIWASPTFNLEHYIQFNSRPYRIGQTQKTEVINVCASNTLEEPAYTRLQGKATNQTEFLDFLKTFTEH